MRAHGRHRRGGTVPAAARRSAALRCTLALLLLLDGLASVAASTSSCTPAESARLGCTVVLDPSTHGAGHPDYFQLSGSSYAGQILCVPGGSWSALALNYVEGTADDPVTIINCGGQVVLDGRDSGLQGNGHWTTINAKGCQHIHLTGTGDPSFEYGFVAHHSASHGVHFDEGSSYIEVDQVETHSNNYGGIVVRTYPRCGGRCGHVEGTPSYDKLCTRGNFIQRNTKLHDNYIHDTPGEGFYVGTSHFYEDGGAAVYDPGSACPGETHAQPELRGVDISNNIVEDTGMDGIQVGSAVEDVKVHRNTVRRWAYDQKFGDANAIGMNPGSTGDVHDNWLEGRMRSLDDSEEYFGIVFHGQGAPNERSQAYNNVVLHVNTAFMFLNREDVEGQQYEFVHNTVYNFTGTAPIKVYCLATVHPYDHPMASITVRNNIFALGQNAGIFDADGHKQFYGNTNGITGMECMDYTDVFDNNLFELDTVANVEFVDAPNLDLHLQGTSPARGAGVALAHAPLERDHDGVTRGDPPDLGAFEHWPAEAPVSATLLNPERGFYFHTEYKASNPSPLDVAVLQGIRQAGRMVLLRVYYLDTFFDTDIVSTTFLEQMAADFQTMLDAGVKCVIRFAYYQPATWPDGDCCVTEPPLPRILAHISSLAPVLQMWTHAIVAVQSGLIGPWGEGHGSTHFECSAADDGKRQILAALLAAVPGRDVQIRYPNLKPKLFLPEEEPDTPLESNLVLNGGFETADGGSPTGAANWGIGVGSGSPSVELTNADTITGTYSIKVNAAFSARQGISLTEAQGAAGNILKIFGNSKLYDPPASMPAASDYSIYVDVAFADGSNLWGLTASFCGSGDWEYAENYVEVPIAKTVASLSLHLMYRNVAQGYALFDDVGVTVFNPYSIEVNSANALDGSDKTRIGHHNDCFLASDTDLGTYTSGNIDSEKAYLEGETRYTSMGGETCALNSPRSDCTTAKDELGRFHYTYLNQDYHPDVIASWETGGCEDEISSRLGYRIVVTSAQLSNEVGPGGDVSYSISFQNKGYARPLHDRRFRLRFVSADMECVMEDHTADLRTWYASDTATYTVSGTARFPDDIADGSYSVYLDLADEHGDLRGNALFKMGVANEGMFDAATGWNDIRQTISINSAADLPAGSSENIVTCGNWASSWDGPERVVTSVDTLDSRVTKRGNGQITLGKGIAKFNGSPRLYISPEDGSEGWDNVELTAYGKYVDQGTAPYKSFSGLTMATRSSHDNYANEPCDAFGYYARIYQESGECSVQKEFYHSTSTGTVYSASNRVDCFVGGLPLGQWIGMKFKVTTEQGTDNVLLELHVDENDDGNWQLKHSLTDSPGSWLSTSSSTVPSECPQNDGDTVMRPGSATFLRTDGVDTTTEVHWRDVFVMNSKANEPPTSSPTSNPTASPTKAPTVNPTVQPTSSPSKAPSSSPTNQPTTMEPTASPSTSPTSSPSATPSASPTNAPTTASPTSSPSTSSPTAPPSTSPTNSPSTGPTKTPSTSPTHPPPTGSPTTSPSSPPSTSPSFSFDIPGQIIISDADLCALGQDEINDLIDDMASIIRDTACPADLDDAMLSCAIDVRTVTCKATNNRIRRRLISRKLQSSLIVEYAIIIKNICIDSGCSNAQEVANDVYDQVTNDLRDAIDTGSLVNELSAASSADIAALLDNAVVTGDFDAVVIPILALLSEWYPDWGSGSSNTCENDGDSPLYMRINGGYFEKSLADCCSRWFGWDFFGCMGGDGNQIESSVKGFYPSWNSLETKCLNATELMPGYMQRNPDQWLYESMQDCCENYFKWAYNECLVSSGDETTVVGTSKWFIDWGLNKCVKDCEDASEPDCRGLAKSWDRLSSLSECCDRLWWIDRKECTL